MLNHHYWCKVVGYGRVSVHHFLQPIVIQCFRVKNNFLMSFLRSHILTFVITINTLPKINTELST